MGLLDGNLDPQSMQTLALAGGLLSPGSFGQGLSRGIAGSQDAALKQQQIEEAKQAIILRSIQAQQQQRMFDLQTPFLEEAARRMRGTATPASASVPQQSIMAGAPGTSPAPSDNFTMGGTSTPPQQPQQSQGGSMFPGLPDDAAFGMIGTGGFSKIPDAIMKAAELTPEMKNLGAAYGYGSPQYKQALQQVAAKSTYIAPVNARPGAILRDPITMQPMAFNPHVPEGATPVFDASGNVTAFNPIANATNLIQAVAAAQAGGKAQYTPYAGVDAKGNPAPVQPLSRVLSPGPVISPDQQTGAIKEQIGLLQKELADPTNTAADKASIQKELNRAQNALLTGKPWSASTTASSAGAVFAAPPLGATTSADAAAKDAVQSYKDIHSYATTSAPRAIGLLQSIEQLADKTLVGPGASKLQFVNGVLNSIGITPGADQAQNYQIMKKNLNMLVGAQRMGASGGGSDALQSLLEAANPNVAEMNGPAAKEAAQELIAFNRMMIAKDKALPNPATTPAPVYQAAETAFQPFNDPRLWQLEHAQNDQERVRILSLVPANERQGMLEKAKAARKAGVLN